MIDAYPHALEAGKRSEWTQGTQGSHRLERLDFTGS